jgi:rare lipoprotein A
VLVGCTSPVPRVPARSDGPPVRAHGDLTKLPDPIPRKEPKSRYGNARSYTVLGKTYQVMDSAAGYRATGLASWYGRKFHGRKTSSGEPFDMFQLTAAHRSLPIPAYLKVTNLGNGRTAIVRVNDRGPFHGDRILDLSYAAAVKLGFAEHGTARVRIEALEDTPDFYLQAGAFRELDAADALKDALGRLTGVPAHVVQISQDSLFRVRLGPVAGKSEAARLQAVIAAADYARPLILGQ